MTSNRSSATMNAIAAALGVSVATVSNALTGKGRVSSDLASSIKAKAGEMGYVPSQAARALRTGRSGVIGLVLPDLANPLFPQVAQAIEHAAVSAGYGVLIGDSRGETQRQTEAIGRLIERGVDGLIVIPRRGSRIGEVGCPVAVIDSPSTPGNTVSADHRDGGVQMGCHLASLGHRRIILLAHSLSSNVQIDRLDGLQAGLGPQAHCEVLLVEELEARNGSGCKLELATKVLHENFTAVAAIYDILALRALTELQREGVDVPGQVSVSGFDDLAWSSIVSPTLTTLRQDLKTIAELAVDALRRAIEETDTRSMFLDRMTVTGGERVRMELVARQSTARAADIGEKGTGGSDPKSSILRIL
jgi:LacI family transcriptional regulator